MQEDRANGGIDVVIAPKDLAEMKGDLANWLKFSDAEKDDKLNAWRKAGKLKLNPDTGGKYWDINFPKYKEALDILVGFDMTTYFMVKELPLEELRKKKSNTIQTW